MDQKSATSTQGTSPKSGAAKSSSSRQAKAKKSPAKKGSAGKGQLTTFQKVVIIVFIAVFALSTLASAFASMAQTSESSDTTSETTSSEDQSQIETIDANYADIVADFESKVAADATDKASILSLGRYYFQWGASVSSAASTDAETSHANELLEKAIAAYDQYLELEDSSAVRVDRALSQYYEGETSNAIQALEELTESDPDYALAWANLGMLYEVSGSTDDATSAYETAAEKDPDDEYGVKTYADQRLSAIESSSDSSSSSSGSSSSSSSSGDLADDLSDLTGVGL